MSDNTSATGDVLSPVLDTPPEYDDDLDALFQPIVAQITGLDGSLVRPRWQPTVGKVPTPNPGTDWCAIGVTTITPDANPYIEHQGGEKLLDYGIRVVSCNHARAVPEFYNQQWVRRYDIGVTFRRKVSRTYRILNIIDAPVELISDDIGIIGA